MLEKRILVSQELLLRILKITGRQLKNLVKDSIAIKVEDNYNLVETLHNYYDTNQKQNEGIKETVNESVLVNFLGIAERTVRELAAKGILKKVRDNEYLFKESVRSYLDYIKTQLDKNGQSREEDLSKKKADRLFKEIKLKELAGELHPASVVKTFISGMVSTCRARLLTIPIKVGAKHDLPNEVLESIKTEVYDSLEVLSEYEPKL